MKEISIVRENLMTKKGYTGYCGSELIEKSKKAYDSLSLVNKGIENISIYSLEKMISVVERYSKMSEDEKGLVKMLLDNK